MTGTDPTPSIGTAVDPQNPIPEGIRPLVALIDRAVGLETPEEIAGTVQDGLSRQIKAGELRLSEALRRCAADHYARNLVYRSPQHGYVIVAMVWGERQGTPLHDHAGTWCVEGVLEGQIEVTQFDLLDRQGDQCRFEKKEPISTGVGTAGSLIPPFEYHTIRNDRSRPSITVHVYGEEMTECSIFEPAADGTYIESKKQLAYDN